MRNNKKIIKILKLCGSDIIEKEKLKGESKLKIVVWTLFKIKCYKVKEKIIYKKRELNVHNSNKIRLY